MLKAFQKYIQSKSLFDPSEKVLLAISGGIDSMVMLQLFQESAYDFEVAHCNFKLRLEASDKDEEFIKEYCLQNNIICYSTSFDTSKIASQRKLSIEETARDLRYSWFSELLQTNNLDYLATAHHKNDVSETMLLNLSRGTGIGGLHGISPKRNKLIRPMLFANKTEIENYANENQINYVYDHTNSDKEYTRNKIRHDIIPLFTSLNPNFINSSNLMANYICETECILEHFINEIRKKSISKRGNNVCIDLNEINENILNQTLIFELIKPYGFNSSQSFDIFMSIGKSGQSFQSKEYELFINRNQIVITINEPNIIPIQDQIVIDALPCKITMHDKLYLFELVDRSSISISDLQNKLNQHIDFDLLELPLKIQMPKNGERFSPFGLRGTKKISDYITDKKIDLVDKKHLLGLYGNSLIALIGLEIDNQFAIKPHTKKALKIELIQKSSL